MFKHACFGMLYPKLMTHTHSYIFISLFHACIYGTAIRGVHVFLSSLRNFASNNASSLIRVSIVCFFPILILGTSTIASKKALSYFINCLVWLPFRYSRFPFLFLDTLSAFVVKSIFLNLRQYWTRKSSIKYRYSSWRSQTKLGLWAQQLTAEEKEEESE